MFGLKTWMMKLMKRYDKKASKTLEEPVLTSVYVRNLRLSRNPKEWLMLVGTSVVASVIPVPPALDRLVDFVNDVVTDSTVERLIDDDKQASYVDVTKKFRMGEDLYVAVTPTKFAILRINAFTFNVGKPVLIVSRRAVSECRVGDKLSFLRYPYNIKLSLVFPNGVAVWFGVHRWLRQRADQLQQEFRRDLAGSDIPAASAGVSAAG